MRVYRRRKSTLFSGLAESILRARERVHKQILRETFHFAETAECIIYGMERALLSTTAVVSFDRHNKDGGAICAKGRAILHL